LRIPFAPSWETTPASDSSQKHVQDVPTFWENFKELFGNSAKATLATNNLILSEQNLGRIQRGEMHMYTHTHIYKFLTY
jgi:hypothetical protein